MVLDSSAIVAIHLKEPGFRELIEKIDEASIIAVGVPTMLETTMVLSSRLSRDARGLVSSFLERINAEFVPFTETHLDVAAMAFLKFGRGRHPAGLNFGDCMAYAIAAVAGLPLLYTGNDFARTDIADRHAHHQGPDYDSAPRAKALAATGRRPRGLRPQPRRGRDAATQAGAVRKAGRHSREQEAASDIHPSDGYRH